MTPHLTVMASDTSGVNWVALTVLIALVTVAGFMATRFKQADSLESLEEWGLGGRKFGTWITWFLLGGDLYTAYTFVAVPAAMFATGAVAGFVATMPYIALQLVGIQAVLEVAGLGGGDNIVAKDAPLFIAFAVLAAYTYSSGLRAPAVIAFVKDI